MQSFEVDRRILLSPVFVDEAYRLDGTEIVRDLLDSRLEGIEMLLGVRANSE